MGAFMLMHCVCMLVRVCALCALMCECVLCGACLGMCESIVCATAMPLASKLLPKDHF